MAGIKPSVPPSKVTVNGCERGNGEVGVTQQGLEHSPIYTHSDHRNDDGGVDPTK